MVRYENALSTIAEDDARMTQLIAECSELRTQLELATVAVGDALLYEELVELIT